MALLTVQDVTFRYPNVEKPILQHCSFSAEAGEFILLCGASGCGKTTLLRLLKHSLAPAGERTGSILFDGKEVQTLEERQLACEIGYVLQNPDAQIVTDRVWHELAFGLESLGYPQEEMALRVAEMANYFGITAHYRDATDTLSGGQKQLLNLASVMVTSPRLLLLDEPTSQLDPITAGNFIATLKRLNRELGLTVILAEHRLEEIFPIADRVLWMRDGMLKANGTPRAVCEKLQEDENAVGLPAAARVWRHLGASNGGEPCPLTVGEGKAYLQKRCEPVKKESAIPPVTVTGKEALSLREVTFRYERQGKDILRGANFALHEGEIVSLLGGNGTGKTTALHVLAGLYPPLRGKVCFFGKDLAHTRETEFRFQGKGIALLPQQVLTLFIHTTVRGDLTDYGRVLGLTDAETQERIAHMAQVFHIESLLDAHPYDLSGGEQERAALAKVLLGEPRVLLLDEPTKGIDPASKRELAALLRSLAQNGTAVLLVTHDVEFAAAYSDRCAMLFDGTVLPPLPPSAFFGRNHFYTTAASRLSRELFGETVTAEDVIAWGEAHLRE